MRNKTQVTKQTFIYIVEKTIFKSNKKGEVADIPAGTVLSQKEYDALPSEYARSKCRQVLKKRAPRVRFTNDEIDVAIKVYLDYTVGDDQAVHNPDAVNEILRFNPNRSYSSANMLLTQIRALDSYVTQEGLSSQSKALVHKLYEVDPDRFPAGEKFEVKSAQLLDNLLAQICA